jgi:hypothetical protein
MRRQEVQNKMRIGDKHLAQSKAVQTERHRHGDTERKETGMALVCKSSTQIEGRGVGHWNLTQKDSKQVRVPNTQFPRSKQASEFQSTSKGRKEPTRKRARECCQRVLLGE